MNNIKALIYKDLRLKRKYLFISLLIWFLFFILAVSYCLSKKFGNLANKEDIPLNMIIITSSITLTLILMLSIPILSDAIYKDFKCGWNKFEYSTPISPQKAAAAKTVLLGILSLSVTFVSIFAAWIIYYAGDEKFTLSIVKNMVIIMFICIIFSILSSVFMFRYKDPQKVSERLLMVVILLMTVVGIIIAPKIALLEDVGFIEFTQIISELFGKKYIAVRNIIFNTSPIIFIAILSLNYYLMQNTIKRREN